MQDLRIAGTFAKKKIVLILLPIVILERCDEFIIGSSVRALLVKGSRHFQQVSLNLRALRKDSLQSEKKMEIVVIN